MGVLCLTHVDLILADSSRPFWGPGNNGCRSLKLPPREALYLSLLFGAGSLSLFVENETAPAAPLIGSLRRIVEGDGRTAALSPRPRRPADSRHPGRSPALAWAGLRQG